MVWPVRPSHVGRSGGLVDEHQTDPAPASSAGAPAPRQPAFAPPRAWTFFNRDLVPCEKPPNGGAAAGDSLPAHGGDNLVQSQIRMFGDQFEKPSRMRFQRRRAASAWFGATLPNRTNRCVYRTAELTLTSNRSSVSCRDAPASTHSTNRPQVQGIAPRLQKTESMSKDSRIHKPLGIPRFTHTGTCSSRR
jgi:hypothetical protein